MNKEITVREYMISIGKVKELKILIENIKQFGEEDCTKKYYSLDDHKSIHRMIDAIIKEITLKNKNLKNEDISRMFYDSACGEFIFYDPIFVAHYDQNYWAENVLDEHGIKGELKNEMD